MTIRRGFFRSPEPMRASLRVKPTAGLAQSHENRRNHLAAGRVGLSYGEYRLNLNIIS